MLNDVLSRCKCLHRGLEGVLSLFSIWDGWIDGLFSSGKLIASRSVFDELEIGGDDLFKWVKQRQSTFVHEDDEQVQQFVIAIQRDWPIAETDFQRRLTGADLFVIGHAMKTRGLVVSHEQFSGQLLHPRIPDACRHLGLECISLAEMFRCEGFSF
jgi:hypothetical protein